MAEISLLERAGKLQENAAMAGQNLHIAQKRDELRYAKTRSGGFVPQVLRFETGTYVYVKSLAGATGTMPKARVEILRVKEVRDSGVIILEGADRVTTRENALNLSPCHLKIKRDLVAEARLRAEAIPSVDLHCQVCCLPNQEATMLICEGCSKGFHMGCIRMTRVPDGLWWCNNCKATGVDKAQEQEQEQVEEYKKGRAKPKIKVFTVEKILEHRETTSKKGAFKIEYKVRWEGYDPSQDTWEPAESFFDKGMINDYHKRLVTGHVAAAAAQVQPAVTKEEARSLGCEGLRDIKNKADFKWISSQQARALMGKLLPGRWDLATTDRLGHHCPGGCRFDAWAGTLGQISKEAALALHKALDYSMISSIIAMHAPGEKEVRAAKGLERIHCWGRKTKAQGKGASMAWIESEWADGELQLDATLPSTFEELRKAAPELIILVPRAELIDIIFPLAVRTARIKTCCLVPSTWLQTKEGPRADWVANLKRYCNMRTIQV